MLKKNILYLIIYNNLIKNNNFKLNIHSLKDCIFQLRRFLMFDIIYLRKIIGLPAFKVRTRSKKKILFGFVDLSFFIQNLFPIENKFIWAEIYNIIWFLFFRKEWESSRKYIMFLERTQLRKKIKFNYLELKFRKVISYGKKISLKKKKNQRKKKFNKNEFNIGFYFHNTIFCYRKYLYFAT